MWYLGWDPGTTTKKDVSGTTGEIQIKYGWNSINKNVPMSIY